MELQAASPIPWARKRRPAHRVPAFGARWDKRHDAAVGRRATHAFRNRKFCHPVASCRDAEASRRSRCRGAQGRWCAGRPRPNRHASRRRGSAKQASVAPQRLHQRPCSTGNSSARLSQKVAETRARAPQRGQRHGPRRLRLRLTSVLIHRQPGEGIRIVVVSPPLDPEHVASNLEAAPTRRATTFGPMLVRLEERAKRASLAQGYHEARPHTSAQMHGS